MLGFLRAFVFFLLIVLFRAVFSQPFVPIGLQSGFSEVENNNGIAVADFDQDNDLDVFIVGRWDYAEKASVPSKLFRNDGDGTFSDVTAHSGINGNVDYTHLQVPGNSGFGNKISASWGDYDNDGFPDLFLTSALKWQLYHNNGDGSFEDVTGAAGFPSSHSCHSVEALWFDYNNDSHLDLYLTSVYFCQNELYRNNGDGTFTNVTSATRLNELGISAWMAIPWDVNDDGFQDLYVAVDFEGDNHLLINQDGNSFIDKAIDFQLTDPGRFNMGIAQGDFNLDGLMDLYLTSVDNSSLYQKIEGYNYQNMAQTLNVDSTGWGWGCQFEDFDHDLDQDLVVINGFSRFENNQFYENQLDRGLLEFVDKADEYGMDEPSKANSIATFDYDNDGDLDIMIGRRDAKIEFFENQVMQNSSALEANWVKIDLVGTNSNRDAIGATVEVYLGELKLIKYKHGSTLMAQNQIPVHFGLGAFDSMDSVVINWPSGFRQSYDDIPSNSFIRITEGENYQIIKQVIRKIPGCTDPESCSYDSLATVDDGSCDYLESSSISGSSTVALLSRENYSYEGSDLSEYKWNVTNGHILDGQGSSSITVEWGLSSSGTVTVQEKAGCVGVPVTMNVSISAENIPSNISVARLWNEALLAAIREDYARPTVHARNLFHTSVAMYDTWAIFSEEADTYLIGNHLNNYYNDFDGYKSESKTKENLEKAISYAAYRLLTHRFRNSPNHEETQKRLDELMTMLGYNLTYSSKDYSEGDAAALGNFIGQSIIDYGLIDGANEVEQYENQYYHPVNEALVPDLPGNPGLVDPNRWQPLQLEVYIDQAGNLISGSTPDFIGPEWGSVWPFAMEKSEAEVHSRSGDSYWVYHDPGKPPLLGNSYDDSGRWDLYKWNFSMVSVWGSHLDPGDGVKWDISPASLGNIAFDALPTDPKDYLDFYDFSDGGDIGKGRSLNPIIDKPYEPQFVPRGDYTRVLAEFWADGPDSETPPGHWYVLLNYVNDHPQFKKKFRGLGTELDPLEWDVKAYFILGGAMHDAAISAWSIKGWYDYIRPVSAIRYMADQGQSGDATKDNFSLDGLPLIEGLIEIVEDGDALAGFENEHVGKIKLYTWRGHDYVANPVTDQAGVGWILAENWWPYQRPSFVTPPFAGYVSGHSTYSRAAAEVLTLLTGSEYFPGGLGEFIARKNEFLVFEEGPSEDVILQWATYRDASDQCSLSRIWGGIHPPADDIPGRLIGAAIGKNAFEFGEQFFYGNLLSTQEHSLVRIYPNPASDGLINITNSQIDHEFTIKDLSGRQVPIIEKKFDPITKTTILKFSEKQKGVFILTSAGKSWKLILE